MNYQIDEDPFFEYDRIAAQGDLCKAQDYQDQPQELSNDDFRNMLVSIQWCYDNDQWQMVINFAIYLQDFFEQQGFLEQGILCTNWAIEASDALNNILIRARLSFNLGLFHDEQGRRTEAQQYYQSSAELARKLGQTTTLADALHRLGWIAHSRRDYTRAKLLYEEAKALRESLDPPDPLALSRSWHQLGILAQDMGDFELAQTHYEKGLALREAHNDLYLKAVSLHQLGALAVEKKQWESARTYFEQSLSLRRSLKDRAGEASVFGQLGFIAKKQQRWKSARNYYLKSLDLQEKLGNVLEMIREKLHLGEVCLAQKDLEQAEDWFKNCLQESKDLKDAYYEGRAGLQLGTVSFLKSGFKAAETYFQDSLKLLSELDGTLPEQAGILYQLGLVAYEQKDFQKASQAFQDSLKIREQEGLRLEAAITHFQLGMVYQVQDSYDVAWQHYQVSLDIFKEEEEVIHYQIQVIYRLGNIAELSKQPRQACLYYRQTERLCYQHNVSPPKQLTAALDRVGDKYTDVKLGGQKNE